MGPESEVGETLPYTTAQNTNTVSTSGCIQSGIRVIRGRLKMPKGPVEGSVHVKVC